MTPATAARGGTYVTGLLWMVFSTVLFVAVDGVIKQAGKTVHPFEVAFFRNVFGFLFLMPALVGSRFGFIRTKRLRLHFLRGVLGVGATLTFFYGLTIVPLVEAISISFLVPVLTVIFLVVFQAERPSPLRWFCVAGGFMGAMVIIGPGLIQVSAGTLIILVSAVLNAAIFIVVKDLSRTESSVTISAWMCIFVGALSFPFALAFWTWPTPAEFVLLVAIGVLATSAQYAVAESFRHADASAMMPAEFLKLIWAALIGYLVFHEMPDVWVFVGAMIIIISNVASTQEKRLASRPQAPPTENRGPDH